MRTFGRTIKPLFNIGLGQIPIVHELYKYVWCHFGPKGVRLTDVNGFKLYIICRDWAVAPAMLFAHNWEPAETNILKRHIKQGMTVIDAGAYIGYYSILASKLVGDKGSVYAFEPSPECLEILYKNIQLNNCKNIKVIEKAVTDKKGQTTFFVSPYNLSGSSMFTTYSNWEDIQNPQIEILTTSLDDVVGNKRIDFIKMDIEGGETKALSGMNNIFKNNPNLKMIIETFPLGLIEVGSSLKEFVDLLQSYFELHIIEKDGPTGEVSLFDIEKATSKTAVINLFCSRKGQ